MNETDVHPWDSTCGPLCSIRMREKRATAHSYSADRKLYLATYTLDTIISPTLSKGHYSYHEAYRYDPLDRRVWVKMVRDSNCATHDKSSGCSSDVIRQVWDGSELLYEKREATDSGTFNPHYANSLMYLNAGGIDEPLALIEPGGPILIYENWQGQYDIGTCPLLGCDAFDPEFPLVQATAWDDAPLEPNGPQSWHGSLITGQRDGSGYQYRRNRYYDPKTGRFTQEDPIGLAGGLNAYGFANGDPITYEDPFGLCPWEKDGIPCAVTWAVGGALAGGTAGAVAGATGGTFVVPGVGTLVGGGGGAVAGALAGFVAGGVAGAVEDLINAGQALLNTRAGDLPAKGPPNSSAAKDDGKGNGQIRDYGNDGRAKTDYDFGHDHGAGDPHAHDWDWTKKPPPGCGGAASRGQDARPSRRA